MATKYLGETIDIHAGGKDLIFPHHENEIAQSEAASGKPFAHYWLHNGYINIDNVKMSKSKGNFFTVRDIVKEFDYEVIRFFMLSAHYRSPINFSRDLLAQAQTALERLYNCREKVEFFLENAADGGEAADSALTEAVGRIKDEFRAAMDDDINTAGALAALFDLSRTINSALDAAQQPSKQAAQLAHQTFMELASVLGVLQKREEDTLDSEVEALIAQRTEARKNKDFAAADAIRDKLTQMGIILKDTPNGVTWSRK